MLRAIKKAIDTMTLFPALVEGTRFNAQTCEDKINGPMYATDLAIELSAQNIPFRTAYKQVAEGQQALDSRKAIDSLNQRVSPGGCADLMLEELKGRQTDD